MARFATLTLVLALAACSPAATAPSLDATADPIAQAFYEEVRTGADLDSDPHLAHELKNPTTYDQIAQFRALMPADAPHSIELRSAEVTDDTTGTTTKITEIYHYADRDLLAQTALFKSPSGVEPVIVGFNLSEVPGGG